MTMQQEKPNCLCFDVGGSSIKYALIDSNLNFSNYGKVPTPYDGVETYLTCLEEIFESFKDQVDAISLSVPGIIDSQQGICIDAGSLKFANGLHLVEELEKRCQLPVYIMNDAKCAALAESQWGALKDCSNGVVIALGTGIGGALILNNEVYSGSHNAAGELSYLSLNSHLDDTRNLQWGNIGNQKLLQMVSKVKNIKQVSGEQLFEWVEAGDQLVIQVLDHFTKEVARMIMNLQFVLDPERFAIGGGISRQPKLLEYIQKNLAYFYAVYPHEVRKAEVVACQYFNEANLLGAYSHYLRSFKTR
ncbi:ROK family protein [Enterococcus sp. 669A]|uniref:ROK family protein n=1 Tax=Candidatus Enterococcus moelleringii TaxID=2815325 RepID=A0ABS3L9H2_9ENTE|nr:ROK family protein [Enterococcus sp. 669A]MBO1306261.1 ROK family protein [Enterococcus sp. 669A]